MIKAISVIAKDDFSILVTLEDERQVTFDLSYIKNISGPVVDPIKNINEFKKVFIRNGIVSWNTGFDIDPYYLIEHGKLLTQPKVG